MNDKRHDGRVIVVGAGLAGLAATLSIVEAGGSVTLLEKSSQILFPGGNAALTISGINGLGSSYQKSQAVNDSLDAFIEDIVKSGGKRTPLVEALCNGSGEAVDWLSNKYDLNFVLSRAGGHNHARTHKTREQATGFALVEALAKKVHELSLKEPRQVEVFTRCQANRLIVTANSGVGAVECYCDGAIRVFAGDAVILATGGYGAELNASFSVYRPDLSNLAICCTLGTTGDGIRMAEAISARTTDLMYVQVNPTGLIDPKDRGNRVKVSASESVRGDGGIIVDRFGNRFVNEVAKRDVLAKALMDAATAGKGPLRIILNSKTTSQLTKYIEEYFAKGLMVTYSDGAELCAKSGIPLESLKRTFDEYNKSAKLAKSENTPDEFGKLHFRNAPFDIHDQLTVAEIEPVIGHCAGGLAIDCSAHVLHSLSGKPIPNLFAAGEVAGGVDPSMLVGNQLLECVVFGRIAGLEAAKQIYGPEYVERHLNPEIVLGELRDMRERIMEELKLLEEEQVERMAENEQLSKKVENETDEIFQVCKILHHHVPQDVPVFEMEFVGNEVVLKPDPKEILSNIRAKERSLKDAIETKKLAIQERGLVLAETQANTRVTEDAIRAAHSKKTKLESQLEKLMNNSSVLREVNDHEAQLAELVKRTRAAEQTKIEEQRAFEHWTEIKRDELSKLRQKKEEMYTMMGIEKAETKKELETMRNILHAFSEKLDYEFDYAKKSAKLSNDPEFPFFHKPLRLPPVLDG